MAMERRIRTANLLEDLGRIVDRLPLGSECRRVHHLIIKENPDALIRDDALASTLPRCSHLESIVLSGVPDLTDRTIVSLASSAPTLYGMDLSGCTQVTDVGILELTAKSLPLQWLYLNGVVGLTDPSISAIGKTCSRLVELELCELPLLTAVSLRDVWSYSRKLRTLRLARCPLLTDKAFPSSIAADIQPPASNEKELPPSPMTWLDELPPLVLRHSADNLRVLELAYCTKLTDKAIAGIIAHAPKIQTLDITGCTALTDSSLDSICELGDNLDTLSMAHVSKVTDKAVTKLVRSCPKIRNIDLAFCRKLTDMSVFELAGLVGLRRLSLVRIHKLTDNAILFLAEHAILIERLHLSYCDQLSLDAVHVLLKNLVHLQHLTATGIPSFKRKGVKRFSDPPVSSHHPDQQAAFRVFSGDKITGLRGFLNKEDQRRRDAEVKNVPFIPRGDDSLDLY